MFGYLKTEAAIAFNKIKKINNKKIKVIFCCYGITNYQIYIENVYDIKKE